MSLTTRYLAAEPQEELHTQPGRRQELMINTAEATSQLTSQQAVFLQEWVCYAQPRSHQPKDAKAAGTSQCHREPGRAAGWAPGDSRDKAWQCQPHIPALIGSPTSSCVLASEHAFEPWSSTTALFHFTLPVVTTGASFWTALWSSEIDVGAGWLPTPGLTCLMRPLSALVGAYQNAGHMFSNSIAAIQLEKCVSLNYGHMLCIPLQHIVSCSIGTEFDTA